MVVQEEEVYYVLKAEGHRDQDIKCVRGGDDGAVYGASRDGTVTCWRLLPDTEALEPCLSYVGHSGVVSCIQLHPSVAALDGAPCIISGGKDGHVILWNIETSAMEAVLDGHSKYVSCIAVLSNGNIVTGSWDCTAIVWSTVSAGICARFLGHTNSVLCVAALPDGSVISGSGDHTICRWNPESGQLIARYAKHTDAVQALAVFPSAMFASCGNDAVIILWSCDTNRVVAELHGHDSFVYSLAVTPDGSLVSASEDRTMRIWQRDGVTTDSAFRCVQCVLHPAHIWTVATLPGTSTLISGDAMGCVRVWTANQADVAVGLADRLEGMIATQPIDSRTATSLFHVNLRGPRISVEELTRTQGIVEGERRLARSGGDDFLFTWVASHWQQSGMIIPVADEAVQADGSQAPRERRKVEYNGKYYDYVFDIDMQGVPLKLPYNVGDSVFDAAQTFVYEHADLGVSQQDKEMIVKHILQQLEEDGAIADTGGAARPKNTSSSGEPAFSNFAREAMQMREQGTLPTSMGFQDALHQLEASSAPVAYSQYAREGMEQQQPAVSPHPASVDEFTFSNYQLFEGIDVTKVTSKLRELGVAEAEAVVRMCDAFVHGSDASCNAAVEGVVSAVRTTAAARVPLVDLLRYLASADTQGSLLQAAPDLADRLLGYVAEPPENDNVKLVSLRALTNLVRCNALQILSMDLVRPLVVITKRLDRAALRNALTAFLQNVSVAICRSDGGNVSLPADSSDRLVSIVAAALLYENDTSIICQYIKSVTTLAASAPPSHRSVAIASVRQTMKKVLETKASFGDPLVIRASKHLLQLISE